MLSVNGRIRVELLLVRSTNAVLSRENYLPLAAHLNSYSQENFSCVSSDMSNTPELSRIVWDTQRSDSQEV